MRWGDSWANPWNKEKEEIAKIFWPSHPVDELEKFDAWFDGTVEYVRAFNPSTVTALIEALQRARETLTRINKPDYGSVDGMIIGDMGLKHFTEYSAEIGLKQIDEILKGILE